VIAARLTAAENRVQLPHGERRFGYIHIEHECRTRLVAL
jgi:hypothetical protein